VHEFSVAFAIGSQPTGSASTEGRRVSLGRSLRGAALPYLIDATDFAIMS